MEEKAELLAAVEALEDAIDCAGAAREDDESVDVRVGDIRLVLDARRALSPHGKGGDVAGVWNTVAMKARQYAGHYSPASDGRNTFIMFAEWAESHIEAALSRPTEGGEAVSADDLERLGYLASAMELFSKHGGTIISQDNAATVFPILRRLLAASPATPSGEIAGLREALADYDEGGIGSLEFRDRVASALSQSPAAGEG